MNEHPLEPNRHVISTASSNNTLECPSDREEDAAQEDLIECKSGPSHSPTSAAPSRIIPSTELVRFKNRVSGGSICIGFSAM
ncbi:hypothetical protein KQX54_015641 [Cotesia glomerata]|uniref:Uncharacterized protein n=1 Tax=Cotesia glomerata TaxID=32391 RepID=A0AAV7HUB3_COTGL|nr:hypothetical protein KQX54_015641 [Cotesia glomerata]